MQTDFAERVALVTGAGGGLGRAYALELARRGARLVVNDLGGEAGRDGPAEAVAGEIRSAGGKALACVENIATRAGGDAAVAAALAAFGRLDILIHNAGVLRHARFEEMGDADIDAVIDVHLKGGFYVGQPAFAAMKRQGYGRVLLTASSSGLFGHPWQASYAAAKAGLFGLANVIALEGKDRGVLCNVIMPTARTRMADQVEFAWAAECRDVGAALAELRELGSRGTGERLDPDWVAPLAVHLVSEACTTTHGVFSASGGRFARVFVGAAEGWTAGARPSAEDIAAHWPQIVDLAGYTEPLSVYDEAVQVRASLRRSGLA